MILSAASKPSPANLSMRAIQFGFSGTAGLAEIESSNRGYKIKVILIYSQVAMAVRQRAHEKCGTFIKDSRRGPFSWDSRSKLREEVDTTTDI